MQPLKGITVVTLEHAIAAPFATRQLADLGARVIKIERPGVGRLRPRLRRARARPGVALRLDQPLQGKPHARREASRGAEVLERLVLEKADVVVQNLAPGAAARLGLGYDELSAEKPAIIVCDISGYGDDGPYRDKKAYDLLIQSEAGLRLGHRHAGRAVQGRPVDRRHRRRHVRVHATSSRRCCSAARPARASTSTSRCWSRWPSG